VSDGTQFSRHDQAKIYELGRRLNHGDYLDQIKAEGELVNFVRRLTTLIEHRGDQSRLQSNERRGSEADTVRAGGAGT
jgi:hypothetical protein